MAFSHLVNCLVLAFGPYVVAYRGKNLSEYRAFKVVLFAAGAYLLTAACKVTVMASLVASTGVTTESSGFDLVREVNSNIFNFVDLLGLYAALRYKYTLMDSSAHRIFAVTIGWGLAESVANNFFYIILNASSDEFTWKYIVRAAGSNIDFLEVYCLVGLMIYITRNVRKTESVLSFQNLVAFAIGGARVIAFPVALSYLNNAGLINFDNYTYAIAKAGLAAGLYVTSKIIGAF